MYLLRTTSLYAYTRYMLCIHFIFYRLWYICNTYRIRRSWNLVLNTFLEIQISLLIYDIHNECLVMKRKLSSSLTLKESQPSSTSYMKETKQEPNIRLAVVSGFFATIGSLLGKLAGGADVDSIALAGSLIFNESTSLTWWCGISFVILGLLVISCTQSKDDHVPFLKRSKSE
ncbi:uncharacterized protein isoform X4 [Bombus fervidus]|uniref:uncharacterized protein isoform X4 n=1 Tax=Bombus fervidus TaxID=203811 RepID=UPI003D18CFCC